MSKNTKNKKPAAKVKPKKPGKAKAKPVIKPKSKPSKPSKAAKASTGGGYAPVQQIYTVIKKTVENLQPQGKMIIDIIREAGGSIERRALVPKLGLKLKHAGSAQTPERVLSFYKQILLGGGYVKIDRTHGEVKSKARVKAGVSESTDDVAVESAPVPVPSAAAPVPQPAITAAPAAPAPTAV